MKTMKKAAGKVLSLILAAAMCLSLVPATGVTAFADSEDGNAAEPVAYTVTIVQGEGGTLTFSGADGDTAYAESGTNVTINVVNDTESPEVDANIYAADGTRIDAEWVDETKFYFEMPESDVTISPEFFGATEEFAELLAEHDGELADTPMTLASDTGYFKHGKTIRYAGFYTRLMTVDGDEAYCLNPSLYPPSNGYYTKNYGSVRI